MAVKSNKITKSKKKNISLDDLALMMGKGFNEVHEKMDKGFLVLDNKIDNVYAELKGDISELKKDFNDLQVAVDGYAKRADTYFQEMVMMAHKVDRMERWILQLAEKAGVQLKA